MIFGRLRKAAPDVSREADTVYEAIVAAARRPAFYAELGAPDTLPGRFELIVLHVGLALRRLRAGGRADFGQALFDAMFRALDANLRELGVGDLTVPKRMKAMARSFYDGLAVYDEALDVGDQSGLERALGRIVYGGLADPVGGPARLAAYVLRADLALAAQPVEELITRGPAFPAIEEQPA
jgi:cytochrome b pre-mRNA-processing protein 3